MTGPERFSREAVDEIFGDALAEGPFGERDYSSTDEGDDNDRRLRDNVPPHH